MRTRRHTLEQRLLLQQDIIISLMAEIEKLRKEVKKSKSQKNLNKYIHWQK